MKKIYSLLLLAVLFFSTGSLRSQTSCATSQPFCAGAGATTFPASTNTSSQSGPNYGCLFTHPNPAWYYFQVSTSGSIVISINGTGGGDVDFICWGPFAGPSGNCGNLTAGNTVDCSYSSSATETCTIPSGVAGQYYQLLITNYANTPQNINFNQTGGSGSTNCGLLTSGVNSATICAGTSTVLTANSNLTGKTYTWNPGGQNTPTISVSPAVTTVYTVTIHGTTSTSTQTTITQTGTVTVNQPPNVSVPPTVTACAGATAIVQSTVTPSGTYTYSWSTGATTSSVSATVSTVETVTVTNSSTGCKASATSNVVFNPLPTVTMPGTQTLTCASPSVSLVGSATPSTCTPVWTGGVCAGANSYTASACTAGTYTLTVTNPATGCSNSGTVSVVASASIPSATASSGTITCTTPTAQVVATTTSTPVSYSWTGPGAIAGASTSTGTVSVGGNYSCVIVNTSSGCSTTVTVNVPVNTTPPAISIAAPATITCAAPTVTLSGSPATGVTYTWTGAGITSGTNSASPTVNQAGIYTLNETSTTNGCTATATVNVVASGAIPSITLTPASLTITCSSPTVGVTATSTTTPLSYSWSPSPFSGVATNTPVFNTPGTYTVTATNSSNGCSTTATLGVSSNTTAPTITITPSQTLTCASPTAVINTTVSPSTGIGYSWSGPGVTGASTSSVTASQGGNYSVTVTNAANGCTNTASSNITPAAGLPSTSISAVPANGVLTCVTHTINLTATTSPTNNITYAWSNGASTASTSTSNAGVVTVTVTNAASGCSVTAQYTVTSNTTTPQLSVSNATVPCGTGSSTVLTASSTNTNVSYSWSATGGGTINSGSATATPNVTGAGNYNVTITDNTNGCTTTSVATVSQPGINAAFSASPASGVAPLAVSFTNQSTGASGYVWNFGNGSGSTSVNPSTGYPTAGTYTVELIAISGTCIDTAFAVIVVNPPFSIEIPNVFTPNGDNINDVFTIKSNGVKELSLIIFNRWGEKLCDLSGANAGWTGTTSSGAKVPDGTYFFIVNATGFDGTEVNKQGTVNLYR